MKRTRQDLIEALQCQVTFLQRSAAAYDAGDQLEAIRLATVAYVILHDGGKRNQSILTQLGVRGSLRFVVKGRPVNPQNLVTDMPLVGLQFQGGENPGALYVPLLANGPQPIRYLQFQRWWEEAVYQDQKKRTLSRKNIVSSLRDQEGGAHFDARLTEETYIGIAKEDSAKWYWTINGQDAGPIRPGPHLATMRQIAWELEQALIPLLGQFASEASQPQT